MAAVEQALADRVEQAKRGYQGAGGQHLDAQLAAGHAVDPAGEIERVLMEDVRGQPGALQAQRDRSLGADHRREGERRYAARGREKVAARAAPFSLSAKTASNLRYSCPQ